MTRMLYVRYSDDKDDENYEDDSHPSWFLSKTLNTFWIFSWSFALDQKIDKETFQQKRPNPKSDFLRNDDNKQFYVLWWR